MVAEADFEVAVQEDGQVEHRFLTLEEVEQESLKEVEPHDEAPKRPHFHQETVMTYLRVEASYRVQHSVVIDH